MALIGVVPPKALGAVVPIFFFGSGLFQVFVTVWAIFLDLSIVAVIFSTFSGFWLSLAALLLGLAHGWFGIPAASATSAEELFFIAWACLFIILVVPCCLWLPMIYPWRSSSCSSPWPSPLPGRSRGRRGSSRPLAPQR